jgi:hypothetical protein
MAGDTNNDKYVALDQWDRYVYMRDSGHLDFLAKADKCMKFFMGLQWEQADVDRLTLQKRPALTINKIISTISTILGEQIYNRMEVMFAAMNGADPAMGDLLNQLWVHDANRNQLNWLRSDMFCDGAITSRGFYDVRVSFEKNLRGDLSIAKMNPKNVLIDPDAEDYDPDTWEDVITTRWQSPGTIAVQWGKEKAKELEERALSSYMYGYDSIERTRDRFASHEYYAMYLSDKMRRQRRYIRVIDRQYKEPMRAKFFVDRVNGDMREIPETWDRERIATVVQKYDLAVMDQTVNKIKWCVTADDLVLHEGKSPYKHFTVVPYFPYFLHGHTIGLVENLISSQELLNKASSQELHVINTTANSGYKMKSGALKNMSVAELEQRGAETGIVLELDDIKNLEKLQPNQIPSGLDRITYKAEEHIKTISNVSDYMTGQAREDVSARAVEANQKTGSSSLAKCTDNLERTDWILARWVLDAWQQYYTEPRIITVTHQLGQDPQTVQLNQVVDDKVLNDLTVGEYSIKVVSAPYRALLEDSQFEQAMKLRENGVQIPDSVLIENSRLTNKAGLIKQLAAASETPEAKEEQQLKMRAQRAAVSSAEADTLVKTTKAKKEVAQAEKLDREDGGEAQADREFALEKEKLDREHALKVEQMDREFALKERQLEAELALKKKAQEDEAMARRAEIAMRPAQEPRQPAAH